MNKKNKKALRFITKKSGYFFIKKVTHSIKEMKKYDAFLKKHVNFKAE